MAVEDYGSIDEFALQYRPGGASYIILDQNLPGLTGLNFLSSDAGAKLGLPVIVLIGHADSALRARAAHIAETAATGGARGKLRDEHELKIGVSEFARSRHP